MRSKNLLPQLSFSILLALSLKPRHGYEIMQQVKEDSQNKISIGPGSLYTAIKQLSDAQLIEEVPEQHNRRKYYQLTDKGKKRLAVELNYFKMSVQLAERRNVFESFRGIA